MEKNEDMIVARYGFRRQFIVDTRARTASCSGRIHRYERKGGGGKAREGEEREGAN